MAKLLTGIPGKTALIFFGVFLLIVLPASYAIFAKVKQILVQADTKELTLEGEKLFNQVKLDPQVVPIPPLGYSIFLRLSNPLRTDSLFASPYFPTYIDQLHGEAVIEIDTLKIVTLVRPLEYGNAQMNFSIARSNQRLSTQIKELKGYLFFANVFSILIAGLLVYFVSGYTLNPIKQIINVAENINASQSIGRVPVPRSQDETKQLALTINNMLARIENSIQNQTNFFASAAHELRTPLTVMKTELTLVQEDKRWHEMLKEVERLERIVNDFLMISQLKSKSLTLRKSEVDLNELLVSALKKVKYLSQERKSSVQINLQDHKGQHMISADEDKLETVLVNLIENAIRYAPLGSVIQISIKGERATQIEIKNPVDHPISNPEKFKQEFVKAEALSAGLGMGVWIANEITLLHHGKLHLRSDDRSFSAILQFLS
ncbi:MAG TPA: histidine kinase dimerization/phospho-acceptor domain-containing protein [Cyclobacteriaceae bacterium]|nr:histidine kinase dimerization/phospho-acceptor domain-containing protein [Cyclobacteriaceae bacterium]